MKTALCRQTNGTIPTGWTPEQFEWLSMLGASYREKARRELLLRQGVSFITPDFVETALSTLQTTKPDEAKHWLPAGYGLIVLADVLPLAPLRSKTRHAVSQLAYTAGLWLESAQLAEAGLQIYEAEGDRRRAANQLFSAGAALHFSRQPIDALALLEKVHPMSEQLGDDWRAALCAIYMANSYYKVGRPGDALLYCLRALPILEAMGDSLLLSGGLVLAGLCYNDLGRFEEALTMYERAKQLFQEKGDKEGIALIYLNIGATLLDMGRLKEAAHTFQIANPLFSELGDSRRAALCDLNRGVIFSQQEKYAEATIVYEKAAEVFDGAGDDYNQAGCYLRMGNDYRWMKRWNESMAMYERAQAMCEASRYERELAECLMGMGYVQLQTGKPSAARDLFEKTLRILEVHRGRVPDPEVASETFYRFETLVPAFVSANLQCGQIERAFEAAQRGKGAVLRQTLLTESASFPEFNEKERGQLERLRMEYEVARHALQETSNPAAGYVQRLRTYERARAELSNYETGLRAKYPRWRNEAVKTIQLQELARSLGRNRAVLEIFIDYRQTTLLLLTARSGKPRLQAHSISIARSELNGLVLGHWQAMRDNRGHEMKKAANRLYDLLIKPLEPHLKGVSELVVCPDQVTHILAFPALMDKKGSYLIERFSITCAPSAAVWHACKTIAARHQSHKQRTPLITALSDFGERSRLAAGMAPAQARRGNLLNRLPHVRLEVQRVVQALKGKAKILLNEQATRESVQREAPKANLLHFATHAFPNGTSPMMSAMVLHPGNEYDAGLLYARDIYEMRLRANLVVLSACSTLSGRYASGEGLMGLAWAFMTAGCPSTIATLWEVHDKASLLWVETFYRHLTAGKSKAESMRQACLQLLRAKDTPRSFTAPHYWACWTLMGDGA